MDEQIILGNWTEAEIGRILREASKFVGLGKRIDFLSEKLLKTKYRRSTLIGDIKTPETFVINLDGLDCFTLLEYIEAMRKSKTFAEFKKNLVKVRYRSGIISFRNRAHFFTDWKSFNPNSVVDITKSIGGRKSVAITKNLNKKQDGTFFVPGVSCRVREFTFIPTANIDNAVVSKLHTGDYAGIYTKKEGLDVSHVGIIIKKDGEVSLRHASSLKKYRKVVDEDLVEYLESKDGIIVFRPVK